MKATGSSQSDWSAKLVNVSISVAMIVVALGVVLKLYGATGGATVDPAVVEAARKRFVDLSSSGQRIGPRDAPVAMVIFTDYQCPACAKFEERLASVRDRIAEPFSVVVRHAPQSRIHPQAHGAAVAAECAGEAGRFEAMHNELFANQMSLPSANLSTIASVAGVRDTTRFKRCLEGADVLASVGRDSLAASAIQLRGTPTLVTNVTTVAGVPPEEELERMIRASLGLVDRQ